jgi:acyl carrier protein
METNSVVERVRGLFLNVLTVDPPEPGTDLIESGLLDSLTLVELIVALEQEFELAIPLDALEIDDFRSIESITAFVEAA